METVNITSPSFWEDQWLADLDRSKAEGPANREKSEKKMDRWDKMATDFARRTSGEKATARREQGIKRLVDKGILTPETRVLDIGAGPGSWALPLAGICAHVTALEPSSGMIEIMRKKIEAAGTDNIFVIQKTWQEADLAEQGWDGAFDLVFASMTPGIDGPAAIEKMIAASRNFCYMSGFSGPGMTAQFAPLWKKLSDRPMPNRHGDIIYPFNLLYAMGFRPDISFSWWDREINWDRDHTFRHFLRFFEPHMDITQRVEQTIADYVDTRCRSGEYVPVTPVCRGSMTWSVKKDRKIPQGGSHAG